MSTKTTLTLITLILLTAALACNLSAQPPTPTPDAQSTIDAAIAATATAMAPQPTPTPTQLPEGVTAVDENYVLVTEEDLNAAIDKSVAEAMAAYEEAYTYTEQATADGELTQEEIDYIYYYYGYAEELIALADDYIYMYYDLYADLVEETIYLLEAVEDDLAATEEAINEVVAIVDTAAETVQAGQEVRQETIDQIASAAANYQQMQQQVAGAWQSWEQNWNSERQQRLQAIQGITPEYVPGSRPEALNELAKYADAVRNAIGDYSLSSQELFDIAQLGANAIAGLQNQGPALQEIAGQIGELTGRLASGNLPGAVSRLSDLESAMSRIPDMPSRPQFNPPSPPSLPSPSLPSLPGGGRRGP